MSKLRDRLTNPKDIERYDRNYNSMEVYITQGELDKEYIHIPNNATNGDVIKAMFPHHDIEVNEQKNYVQVFYDSFYTTYPLRWWFEPYKAGGAEESEESDAEFMCKAMSKTVNKSTDDRNFFGGF